MFNHNNSVHVATPTGASTFSVGGRTIYSLFKIGAKNAYRTLTNKEKEAVGAILDTTTALFFDERSMIAQKVLGATENNGNQMAHTYGHG
jgi:hypothetical protein